MRGGWSVLLVSSLLVSGLVRREGRHWAAHCRNIVQCFHGLHTWTPHGPPSPCPAPPAPACRGIIGSRLLSWLPAGACVINAARGGHLVEADLLAALDLGHVSPLFHCGPCLPLVLPAASLPHVCLPIFGYTYGIGSDVRW